MNDAPTAKRQPSVAEDQQLCDVIISSLGVCLATEKGAGAAPRCNENVEVNGISSSNDADPHFRHASSAYPISSIDTLAKPLTNDTLKLAGNC